MEEHIIIGFEDALCTLSKDGYGYGDGNGGGSRY